MANQKEKLEEKELIQNEEIKNLIYTIRGKQVMLDSDVAMLYQYDTKNVNKAMKRNRERFPEDFCFKLTEDEFKNLRFQIGTLNKKVNNGKVTRKYLPYVYTEQGIAMLAGILKNDIAIKVSIMIIRAFIEMRKFIMSNTQVFDRLTNVEYKLIEHDKKFDKVFNELQRDENIKQKIFFKGQIYDAYSLVVKLIKRADKKIVIIDNYIDDSVLDILMKKKKDVEVEIVTSNNCKIENLDVSKFNEEYPSLKITQNNKFHDRFILIDNKELYYLGASIKDLGKKCFGITKIEDEDILNKFVA